MFSNINVKFKIKTVKLNSLLFFLFFIASCDNKDSELYVFDPVKIVENSFTLFEIADDVQYIPLNSSYPISIIYNCYFVNNSIYLNTRDIGVLKFNFKGELLKKIGSVGRGPGEYTRFTKFTVDNDRETIYVQDSGNRVHVYTSNGTFLRTLIINGYDGNVELVSCFNSKLFVFNYLQFGDAKYNWVILDTLGNLLRTKEIVNPSFNSGWSGKSGFYFLNKSVYYWNIYNDTVYCILPGSKEKASFLIGQGEFRFPRATIDNQSLSKYVFFDSLFETGEFIIVKYYFKETAYFVLVEKKSGKSYVNKREKFDKCGIPNDLDGGVEFIPSYFYQDKTSEYMVAIVDALHLKTYVVSEEFRNANPKYPEKKKELEKLASSLNETDNPVLMIVRLKK